MNMFCVAEIRITYFHTGQAFLFKNILAEIVNMGDHRCLVLGFDGTLKMGDRNLPNTFRLPEKFYENIDYRLYADEHQEMLVTIAYLEPKKLPDSCLDNLLGEEE